MAAFNSTFRLIMYAKFTDIDSEDPLACLRTNERTDSEDHVDSGPCFRRSLLAAYVAGVHADYGARHAAGGIVVAAPPATAAALVSVFARIRDCCSGRQAAMASASAAAVAARQLQWYAMTDVVVFADETIAIRRLSDCSAPQ
jgi:hypothetical protein